MTTCTCADPECPQRCDHKWQYLRDWIGDRNVVNGVQYHNGWQCQRCGETTPIQPDDWTDPRELDGDYLRDKAIDDEITGWGEMSDVRVVQGRVAMFDGMAWELPNDDMGELAWRMRYTRPTDPQDAMRCAGIIEAYMQLVAVDPIKIRNHKIAQIRKALQLKVTQP